MKESQFFRIKDQHFLIIPIPNMRDMLFRLLYNYILIISDSWLHAWWKISGGVKKAHSFYVAFVFFASQGCTIIPAQTLLLNVHFGEGFFNNYSLEQFHVIKEHIICYCNESWL